ncbi:hypothetical protein [Flavobacterium geliluteum]|uniref:Uncharacterized protein n=1 Tax=Flavobacterium geliluteum TaxID=2816120 RepID=A0A940X8F5_9FLAO|nr:hypothetical protein [Flavobacterium geliluteum]MBP4137437.1 hypothetical protein [Flavobacterium geliluteum]
MGRELKRVPLDFNWPSNQVWKGFINPFRSQECKSCDGCGLNPATKKLQDEWYASDNPKWVDLPNGRRYNDNGWSNHITEIEIAALIKERRLGDFTSVFKSGEGWVKKDPEYIPTPDEVNEWNRTGMGHDSINRWICVEARAKHLGIYGKCEFCEGEGEIWQSEEIKKMHDDWKDFEPPTGEGFQLWETTSEGGPNSPVFKTLDELCEWCGDNATTFGSSKATKEQWKSMLKDFVHHQSGNMIFL